MYKCINKAMLFLFLFSVITFSQGNRTNPIKMTQLNDSSIVLTINYKYKQGTLIDTLFYRNGVLTATSLNKIRVTADDLKLANDTMSISDVFKSYINSQLVHLSNRIDRIESPSSVSQPTSMSATGYVEKIKLNWVDNATTETGYDVYKSITGINFTKLASIGANSTAYTDSLLSYPYKAYYYVVAVGSSGSSLGSDISSASTLNSVSLSPLALPLGEIDSIPQVSPVNALAFVRDAETNNLTNWDKFKHEGNGSITTTTDTKLHGSYGYKVHAGTGAVAEYMSKYVGHTDSINVRFYFKMPSITKTGVANKTVYVACITSGNTTLWSLGLNSGADSSFYRWASFNNIAATSAYSTSGFSFGAWHCVDLYYKKGTASDGKIRVFMDNVQIDEQLTVNNSSYSIDSLRIGVVNMNSGVNFGSNVYFYYDDIAVDTYQRIGLIHENTADLAITNNSVNNNLILNSFYGLSSGFTFTLVTPDTVFANSTKTYTVKLPSSTKSGDYNDVLHIGTNIDTLDIPIFATVNSTISIPTATSTGWYVSKSATGSANGKDWSHAWRSASQIIWDSLAVGDTLFFDGGADSVIWNDNVVVSKSGSNGNTIYIMPGLESGHNGRVIFDGQLTKNYAFSLSGRSYVTVKGFNIRNYLSNGIYITAGCNNVTIDSCNISSDGHADNSASIFVQSSKNTTVNNCYIYTPSYSSYQTDGIYSQRNSGNIYKYNTIIINNSYAVSGLDGHNDGIQSYLDTSDTFIGNFIWQNNTKTNNAQGIYVTTGAGSFLFYDNVIYCPYAKNNIGFRNLTTGTGTLSMYFNTLVCGTNSVECVLYITDTPDPIIKNNIFYHSSSTAKIVKIQNWNGTYSNIDHNIYYYATSQPIAFSKGTSYTYCDWSTWTGFGFEDAGYVGNPSFVDMRNGNFYISGTSIAKDKGVNIPSISLDILKNSRTYGSYPDCGAFEYVPTIPIVIGLPQLRDIGKTQ